MRLMNGLKRLGGPLDIRLYVLLTALLLIVLKAMEDLLQQIGEVFIVRQEVLLKKPKHGFGQTHSQESYRRQ